MGRGRPEETTRLSLVSRPYVYLQREAIIDEHVIVADEVVEEDVVEP